MIISNNSTKLGFKHTPLGWLPEDWQLKKIRDIAKISSGTTPLRSESRFHTDGTIKWVKTTDLNNSVIVDTEERITESALSETSLRIYPVNTVLVAMYGGFNQIGRTGILGVSATINQALSAITVDASEFAPQFILHWLNANVGYWKNLAGSSRKDPNITSKDVGDFPIVKINLFEQKVIVELLNAWDKAITTTTAVIAHKEQRKKWLMQQLLTGKKRLKGFSGKWKQYSYDEILKTVKRPVEWNDDELYRLISVRRRSGGIFPREALYGHQIKVKDLRTARKGDFLFSKMQILHGASALVDNTFDGCQISGSYIAVVARDPNLLSMEFFSWHSQTPYFYHQTYVSSYGVHIEKMTFDFESFLSLQITLPPFEEQVEITKVFKAADDEIQIIKQQLEKLKVQKKGLMQVLLTGRKRMEF